MVPTFEAKRRRNAGSTHSMGELSPNLYIASTSPFSPQKLICTLHRPHRLAHKYCAHVWSQAACRKAAFDTKEVWALRRLSFLETWHALSWNRANCDGLTSPVCHGVFKQLMRRQLKIDSSVQRARALALGTIKADSGVIHIRDSRYPLITSATKQLSHSPHSHSARSVSAPFKDRNDCRARAYSKIASISNLGTMIKKKHTSFGWDIQRAFGWRLTSERADWWA